MERPPGLSPAARMLWDQFQGVDLGWDSNPPAVVVTGGGEYDGVYYLANRDHNQKPFWRSNDGVIWWDKGWRIDFSEVYRSEGGIKQPQIHGVTKCKDITKCNAWVDSATGAPVPVSVVPYTQHPKMLLDLQRKTQRMEAQLSF
eukprot:Hpha_TRINITY_DN15665_c3_g1::TRINITY_DN15665_c3_g1_i1::g.99292::m.99292